MKITIKKFEPIKEFKPFTLEIDIQTLKEAQDLLRHINESIDEFEFTPVSDFGNIKRYLDQELTTQGFMGKSASV